MRRATAIVVLILLTAGFMSVNSLNPRLVWGWSNGGFSSDPNNPNYGTHDWIAQHALDWLPTEEKQYILNNLTLYLYGTELPDNNAAPDGIGDSVWHHAYFNESEVMTEDWAAFRAQWESERVLYFLNKSDLASAAKTAGIMSHYLADVAAFGHVMGASTPWGAETHHADYETYVNDHMNDFNSYLAFDGNLTLVSAYNATKSLAYDTTFDVDGDLTCVWMDQNYNWSNPEFKNRTGESLNLAVNSLADVLHTLHVKSTETSEKATVFPSADVGLTFENVTAQGLTTVNKTDIELEPPPLRVVKKYCDIETTANYSREIELRIIYDIDVTEGVGLNVTSEEERSLQLMQWNETTQQWETITTTIDVKNNMIAGETSHLSVFGVTSLRPGISTNDFSVTVANVSYSVSVQTNSSVSNFSFDQNGKSVSFNVDGTMGTVGACHVLMPMTLLGAPYTVRIDNETILGPHVPPTNSTHAFIYFTYNHSSHVVKVTGTTVVPEFNLSAAPLLTLLTLLAIVTLKRRKAVSRHVNR